MDNYAPIKTIQIRKNYKPYLSYETKTLIQNRKAVQEEAVKTGCRVLKTEFNRLTRQVKRNIEQDRKHYFENKLKSISDSSSVWRTSKELLGVTQNLSPTAILHKNVDEVYPRMVTKPDQLAPIFNNYFVNKIKALRSSSRQTTKIDPVHRLQCWLNEENRTIPEFGLQKIDRQTLRRAVKRLKGKHVSGVDSIDSYSLKIVAPLLEDALLHLVNLSIEKNEFAKNWKPQLILPLYKKKERTLVENYRPVSNLVEMGKLVEYVVGEQILSHFIKHRLFHPNHHGSLPNHSTATALIQLTDMWIQAAEKRELSGVCMIDQSAAYDLLDHDIFLNKIGCL